MLTGARVSFAASCVVCSALTYPCEDIGHWVGTSGPEGLQGCPLGREHVHVHCHHVLFSTCCLPPLPLLQPAPPSPPILITVSSLLPHRHLFDGCRPSVFLGKPIHLFPHPDQKCGRLVSATTASDCEWNVMLILLWCVLCRGPPVGDADLWGVSLC